MEEIQHVAMERLKRRLAQKKPLKTNSKEYIGFQKEFHKLMQQQKFAEADSVQRLMKRSEEEHMQDLLEKYESMV